MRRNVKKVMITQAMRVARTACAVALLAGLFIGSACNAPTLQAPDALQIQQTELRDIVNPIRDLDIIFMVDNSNSMREEQENLNRNFPTFMRVLQNIEGGLPNIHVGVVSSDVGAGNITTTSPACNRPGGDRGQFIAPPQCGLQAGAKYLISLNNGRDNNFTGNLAEVFACMANLGTGGCGFEHQLQSVRIALTANEGFLRRDAYLALIFLTDEDDCSAPPETDFFVDPQYANGQHPSLRCSLVGHQCQGQPFPLPVAEFSTPLSGCVAHPQGGGRLIPVQTFIDEIRSVKGANADDKILVSAIIGWPTTATIDNVQYRVARDPTRNGNLFDNVPICTSSTNGNANVGLRMKAFVDGFGRNGLIESICQDNYEGAMRRIAELIANKFVSGCIPNELADKDQDPTNGHQPECRVVEHVPDPQTGTRQARVIGQECNNTTNPSASTNKPCWILQPVTAANNQMCSSNDKWRIRVIRDGDPERDTLQVVKCLTCPRHIEGICR